MLCDANKMISIRGFVCYAVPLCSKTKKAEPTPKPKTTPKTIAPKKSTKKVVKKRKQPLRKTPAKKPKVTL